MFDTIESFLTNMIGEDAAGDLLECLTLLDEIDYKDHHFPLADLLGTLESKDKEVSVSIIRSILNDNYRLILKSMGIKVSDEADQRFLYNILFTLTKIEAYELKDEIKAILDDGASGEEIIAELITMITGVSIYDTLEYISNVSPDLIERIDDLCDKEVAEKILPSYVDKSVVKDNAKRYFAKHPESHIRELIRQGFPLGEHREMYVKALEQHYFSFDPTPEEYAQDILGLVISTSTTEVLSQAQNLTTTFVHEGEYLIKVNSLINSYYNEVFT